MDFVKKFWLTLTLTLLSTVVPVALLRYLNCNSLQLLPQKKLTIGRGGRLCVVYNYSPQQNATSLEQRWLRMRSRWLFVTFSSLLRNCSAWLNASTVNASRHCLPFFSAAFWAATQTPRGRIASRKQQQQRRRLQCRCLLETLRWCAVIRRRAQTTADAAASAAAVAAPGRQYSLHT